MTRLRSVTTRPIVAAISSVSAADDRADVGRRRRLLEQRVHARDQVDAGGDHRRGVDQGGDRRRALHGVREPGVERDLGGLGERADQQQHAARHEVGRRCGVNASSTCANVCRKSSVPVPRKMKNVPSTSPTSPTTLMTNALMPACGGGRAPVPEARSAGRTRRRRTPSRRSAGRSSPPGPAAACEHEEVQVGEEARVAAVAAHVGDRVEVDQRRDAGDDEHHAAR